MIETVWIVIKSMTGDKGVFLVRWWRDEGSDAKPNE